MVPFAFMRGRSFDNTLIICDEAQNTTTEQMRMLVTRLGHDSKMIISGDTKQTDIKKINGLSHFIEKLKTIQCNDIDVVNFTKEDIVRNKLIDFIEEKIYGN